MGKLIVLDGLDGSGKETQSKILLEKLIKKKIKAIRIEYPNYTEDSSSLVKLYLEGKINTDPFKVNPFAASSFYACDHYITYEKNWKDKYFENYIIIADRYISSNAIYQMAKLEKYDWGFFLNWLYDFEFKRLELPKEDILIYLDVDVNISTKLINSRNVSRDIHEKNLKYLKRCKEAAMFLAERLGWNVVKCYDKNEILNVEEIARKVEGLMLNIISN